MFSPCCYSEIHFDIEKGNLNFFIANIINAPSNVFGLRYVFWRPLEFAKFKLNLAKKFKPSAVDNALKIYCLARDYSLFHAISAGNLTRVRDIINYHSEGLNLNLELRVERIFISLIELAKVGKDRSSINSEEVHAILTNFLGPNSNAADELEL